MMSDEEAVEAYIEMFGNLPFMIHTMNTEQARRAKALVRRSVKKGKAISKSEADKLSTEISTTTVF